MTSSIDSVWRPYWRVALLLMTAIVVATPWGCKPKAKPEQSSSSSATSRQRAACSSYTKQLCDKAGPESPTCEAVTTASAFLSTRSCEAALADMAFSLNVLAEQGKSCAVLTDKLCTAVGQDSQACAMVKMQTKGFDATRCVEMLRNFDDVLAGLRQAAAANGPINAAVAAQVASGRAPEFGPAEAPATLVVFSDFQCHFCAMSAEALKGVVKRYGDRVKVVFRHFPLASHPGARLAAEAALAAEAQGKFVPMHDSLFQDQEHQDRTALEARARVIGLNIAAFNQALDRHEFAEAIDTDLKLGELASVHATPTIFVNGTRVLDPTNEGAIAQAIDSTIAGPTASPPKHALAE